MGICFNRSRPIQDELRIVMTTPGLQKILLYHSGPEQSMTEEIFAGTAKRIPLPNTAEQASTLRDAFRDHSVLSVLAATPLFTSLLCKYVFAPGDTVLKAGDPATGFFWLEEGTLEVSSHPAQVLCSPYVFGEEALIPGQVWPHTVIARTLVVVWATTRSKLVEELKHEHTVQAETTIAASLSLPKEYIGLISGLAIEAEWEYPEEVSLDTLFILRSGSLLDENGTELREGAVFGAPVFMPVSTCTLLEKVRVLAIDAAIYAEVTGISLQEHVLQALAEDLLKTSKYSYVLERPQTWRVEEHLKDTTLTPSACTTELRIVLSGLIDIEGAIYSRLNYFLIDKPVPAHIAAVACLCIPLDPSPAPLPDPLLRDLRTHRYTSFLRETQLKKLLEYGKVEQYALGARLFKFQECPDQLFFILHGQVEVQQTYPFNIVLESHIVASEGLTNNPLPKLATAKTNVVCFEVLKSDFLNCVDSITLDLLVQSFRLHKVMPNFSDTVVHQMIFSTRERKKLRATANDNQVLLYFFLTPSVEYQLLLQLDHLLVPVGGLPIKNKFGYTLIARDINGSPLSKYFGQFGPTETPVLVACFVRMLEFLHSFSVIHRGFNPESLVIDRFGLPRLIDIQHATLSKGRTYTVVGNPVYMAPEMILGSGYSFQVDWWAFGMTVYQLLYQTFPFESTSPIESYRQILNFSFKPSDSSPEQQFLQMFLRRDPVTRGSSKKAREHPWLESVDWNSVGSVATRDIPQKQEGLDVEQPLKEYFREFELLN